MSRSIVTTVLATALAASLSASSTACTARESDSSGAVASDAPAATSAGQAAVVTYVRASWGNNASPVTAEQVAELRASAGARAAWTADELTQAYGGK
jgi:hypothetical protein